MIPELEEAPCAVRSEHLKAAFAHNTDAANHAHSLYKVIEAKERIHPGVDFVPVLTYLAKLLNSLKESSLSIHRAGEFVVSGVVVSDDESSRVCQSGAALSVDRKMDVSPSVQVTLRKRGIDPGRLGRMSRSDQAWGFNILLGALCAYAPGESEKAEEMLFRVLQEILPKGGRG